MEARHPNVARNLPTLPLARLVGHDGPVQAVTFTACGQYCATAGGDCTARLWNPARLDPAFPPDPTSETSGCGRVPIHRIPRALPIQTFRDGMAHPVAAVAIDSSGDRTAALAAASDKTLLLCDVLTGATVRRLPGHYGRINAVAFGPEAHTVLSASYDATVRVWDGRSRSGAPIQTLADARDSVTDVHVASAADQAVIRTCSVDGTVRSYDLRKGVVRLDHVGSPVTGMAPTRDGLCLAASCLDGTIRLMELDSGELLNTYSGGHAAGQFGLGCSLSGDDATVVSGSEDGAAVLYDLVSARVVQRLQGHTRPVCSVAAHPRVAPVVITAGYDGHCIVWGRNGGFLGW